MKKNCNVNPSGKVVNHTSNKVNRCLDNHSDLTERRTIKILFINVNFLRKKLDFPDFIDYLQNYDIISFAETKLDEYDQLDIPGFNPPYLNNRVTKSNVNSGGIAVAFKSRIENFFQKDDSHTSETVLWFEEKHKLLRSQNKVMFGFVYIPPNQSKYYDNNSFGQLERDIINFQNSGYSVVLLGDFNARTKTSIDYVETDEDLIERLGLDVNMLSTTTDKTALGLEILKRHDISISRHSKDKCKNSHGTLFLDVLKNCSLFIMNGRVGRDALIGKATCEGISLVDYAISSTEIFPIVKDFCVHDFNPIFSGVHCAISLELEVENRKENEKYQAYQISVMNCSIETTNMPNIRHDWSSDSINRFKNDHI